MPTAEPDGSFVRVKNTARIDLGTQMRHNANGENV
jgi:hypothetical protein